MADNRRFIADITRHRDMTEARMRAVFVDAVTDVLAAAQTSAQGITAGGVRVEGRIPVVSGDLIKSLNSSLNGAAGTMGAGSYAVALAGLEIGDVARFEWTMEYALRIEHGFTGTDALGRTYDQPGWHFVGHNAAKWPDFVAARARLVAA
jgi:hypothetical protein